MEIVHKYQLLLICSKQRWNHISLYTSIWSPVLATISGSWILVLRLLSVRVSRSWTTATLTLLGLSLAIDLRLAIALRCTIALRSLRGLRLAIAWRCAVALRCLSLAIALRCLSLPLSCLSLSLSVSLCLLGYLHLLSLVSLNLIRISWLSVLLSLRLLHWSKDVLLLSILLLGASILHRRVLSISLTLWVSSIRLVLRLPGIVQRLVVGSCCLLIHLLCIFVDGGLHDLLLAIVRCPLNREPVLIKLVDIVIELLILLVRVNNHLDHIHCFLVECLDVRSMVCLQIFDLSVDRRLDSFNSFNAILGQLLELSIEFLPCSLEFLDSVTLSFT